MRVRAELDRASRNYQRQKMLLAEGATPRLTFEKAEREGSSSIQLDGYFIDYPIVYKAQKTLDMLRAIEAAG